MVSDARGLIRSLRPVIEPALVAMLDRIHDGEARHQVPTVVLESIRSPGSILHEIEVDVEHYNVEDLTVRTIDRNVVVKGAHSQRLERGVNQCFATRQFAKSYRIPDNVDMDMISCDMTTDNYLFISAPVRAPKHRLVPIRMTGMKRLQRRPGSGLARAHHAENVACDAEREGNAGDSAQDQVKMETEGSEPQASRESADTAPQASETSAVTAPQASEASADSAPQASGMSADDAPHASGVSADAAPQASEAGTDGAAAPQTGGENAEPAPRACDADPDAGRVASSNGISKPK